MGRNFNGDVAHDIEILQRLLDTRKIKNDMTQQLQAMGFVLGDLLANELDMHWVIYKDNVGRSRALRYKSSNNFLFPVTMISRRREVNNLTSVAKIYEKAFNSIAPLRDPLPFQWIIGRILSFWIVWIKNILDEASRQNHHPQKIPLHKWTGPILPT